jgi:predicted transcriptional regulator
MPRRLPPLNALKAFEAAARHESFTRAAEELCVTQGAVSHQVKALEAELGLAVQPAAPKARHHGIRPHLSRHRP